MAKEATTELERRRLALQEGLDAEKEAGGTESDGAVCYADRAGR